MRDFKSQTAPKNTIPGKAWWSSFFSDYMCEIQASPPFIREARGQPGFSVSWDVRWARSHSLHFLHFLQNSVPASLIQTGGIAPYCPNSKVPSDNQYMAQGKLKPSPETEPSCCFCVCGSPTPVTEVGAWALRMLRGTCSPVPTLSSDF